MYYYLLPHYRKTTLFTTTYCHIQENILLHSRHLQTRILIPCLEQTKNPLIGPNRASGLADIMYIQMLVPPFGMVQMHR